MKEGDDTCEAKRNDNNCNCRPFSNLISIQTHTCTPYLEKYGPKSPLKNQMLGQKAPQLIELFRTMRRLAQQHHLCAARDHLGKYLFLIFCRNRTRERHDVRTQCLEHFVVFG